MPLGKKYLFLVFLILPFPFGLHAQLSPEAQISVITCGPGTDLYATFGHSAIRVQDPANNLDLVYNYGTFDFNTPNFYLKFARGKLLYSLSRGRFEDFLYTYQLEDRWVKEQVLQLRGPERNEIFRYLETNYLPENRDYKYDFLFNNCSTKIPEVLTRALSGTLQFDESYLIELFTFRQLIQQYLDTNSWSSLGIDLALGAVIDRKASVAEHMFLPDYVYMQLNHAMLDGKPLVARERNILLEEGGKNEGYFTLTPAFWLLIALLFTATITYIDHRNATRSTILDFVLFLLTGLLGLFMLFLWFLTDHSATAWNFNLLWAFPGNIVLAFYLLKNRPVKRMRVYMLSLLLLIGLALLLWLFGLQVFSPLLLLFWGCLAIRYVFLLNHYKKIQSRTR